MRYIQAAISRTFDMVGQAFIRILIDNNQFESSICLCQQGIDQSAHFLCTTVGSKNQRNHHAVFRAVPMSVQRVKRMATRNQ